MVVPTCIEYALFFDTTWVRLNIQSKVRVEQSLIKITPKA